MNDYPQIFPSRGRPTTGPRRAGAGFSLLELVIIVMLLGIITLLALPALTDARGKARDQAFAANLRDLAQLAQLYHQKWHVLPPQAAGAQVPPALLSETGRTEFPLTTPVGGYWHMGQMPDGTWGVGVWWDGSSDDTTMKRDCKAVDAAIDDGHLSTGRFVCDEGSSRYYWLIQ